VTARLVVFGLGLAGAVVLAFVAEARGVGAGGILLLACCPLVVLSLPAGLLAWGAWRHGDPYNVEHRYR
jgi:thiamine transporter ThiT